MANLPQAGWDRFTSDLEALNRSVMRTKMKWDLLDDTDRFFYDATGEIGAGMAINDIYQKLAVVDEVTGKMNQIYVALETGKAGVRLRKYADGNDDFEVVAKPEFAEDPDMKYLVIPEPLDLEPSLGIPPLVIAAGVGLVLVGGTLITLFALHNKQVEIEAEVDKKQLELEEKIIERPEVLQDFTEYKQTVQGTQRGLIDSLLGAGSGKTLLGGAAGIAAVVIAGYFIMKAMEKRKAT